MSGSSINSSGSSFKWEPSSIKKKSEEKSSQSKRQSSHKSRDVTAGIDYMKGLLGVVSHPLSIETVNPERANLKPLKKQNKTDYAALKRIDRKYNDAVSKGERYFTPERLEKFHHLLHFEQDKKPQTIKALIKIFLKEVSEKGLLEDVSMLELQQHILEDILPIMGKRSDHNELGQSDLSFSSDEFSKYGPKLNQALDLMESAVINHVRKVSGMASSIMRYGGLTQNQDKETVDPPNDLSKKIIHKLSKFEGDAKIVQNMAHNHLQKMGFSTQGSEAILGENLSESRGHYLEIKQNVTEFRKTMLLQAAKLAPVLSRLSLPSMKLARSALRARLQTQSHPSRVTPSTDTANNGPSTEGIEKSERRNSIVDKQPQQTSISTLDSGKGKDGTNTTGSSKASAAKNRDDSGISVTRSSLDKAPETQPVSEGIQEEAPELQQEPPTVAPESDGAERKFSEMSLSERLASLQDPEQSWPSTAQMAIFMNEYMNELKNDMAQIQSAPNPEQSRAEIEGKMQVLNEIWSGFVNARFPVLTILRSDAIDSWRNDSSVGKAFQKPAQHYAREILKELRNFEGHDDLVESDHGYMLSPQDQTELMKMLDDQINLKVDQYNQHRKDTGRSELGEVETQKFIAQLKRNVVGLMTKASDNIIGPNNRFQRMEKEFEEIVDSSRSSHPFSSDSTREGPSSFQSAPFPPPPPPPPLVSSWMASPGPGSSSSSDSKTQPGSPAKGRGDTGDKSTPSDSSRSTLLAAIHSGVPLKSVDASYEKIETRNRQLESLRSLDADMSMSDIETAMTDIQDDLESSEKMTEADLKLRITVFTQLASKVNRPDNAVVQIMKSVFETLKGGVSKVASDNSALHLVSLRLRPSISEMKKAVDGALASNNLATQNDLQRAISKQTQAMIVEFSVKLEKNPEADHTARINEIIDMVKSDPENSELYPAIDNVITYLSKLSDAVKHTSLSIFIKNSGLVEALKAVKTKDAELLVFKLEKAIQQKDDLFSNLVTTIAAHSGPSTVFSYTAGVADGSAADNDGVQDDEWEESESEDLVDDYGVMPNRDKTESASSLNQGHTEIRDDVSSSVEEGASSTDNQRQNSSSSTEGQLSSRSNELNASSNDEEAYQKSLNRLIDKYGLKELSDLEQMQKDLKAKQDKDSDDHMHLEALDRTIKGKQQALTSEALKAGLLKRRTGIVAENEDDDDNSNTDDSDDDWD